MSNLRIVGLVIGIVGLLSAFLIYRGPKWKRSNFILFSFFSLCLIVVTINPNVVNFVRDALSLQKHQYGRLIALLILSNVFLLFFSLYTKFKVENIRLQFDRLVRSMGTSDLEKNVEVGEKIKPIMIVIPAYNEAENLREILPKIPKEIGGIEVGVLVSDDGSEDNTTEIVHQYGHVVVSNRINRGQGAANRLGYDVLTKHNVSVGVTMDADNQHRPEDLERLIAPILNGQYDLVVGSRILGNQEKTGTVRNLGIAIFSKVISLVMGLRITDCSSGFKAFNMKRLRSMNLTEDQFQSAEVLIEARKKGLRIGEVPVTVNCRKHGRSKKGKDWGYGLHFTKTILKTWWR